MRGTDLRQSILIYSIFFVSPSQNLTISFENTSRFTIHSDAITPQRLNQGLCHY